MKLLALSKQERRIALFLLIGLVVGAVVNAYKGHRGVRLDNVETVASMDSLRREFVARASLSGAGSAATLVDSGPQASVPVPTHRGLRVVDINRASAEELQKLPHIGPTLAQRIVAYRQQQGPFRSIEEIKRVKGIGEQTFARIRPYLTIG